MKNQRFHLSDSAFSKNTEGMYGKALAAGTITPEDAALIREFINENAGSISAGREYKIVNSLILNRAFFPPYQTCRTGDVQEGVRRILNAYNEDGTPRFKPNTKTDRIKIAKRFFLWMAENEYGESLNEKKIQHIRPPSPDKMTKTAADILTEDEVKRMLAAARTSRDRAIISVLYEGGLRAAELGSLVWGDLRFNAWNVVLNTDGKTGAPRYVPLIMSRQYLAQWRCDTPGDSANPAAFVFVNLKSSPKKPRQYLPLTYWNVVYIIQELAAAAGIKKHITPHIFRHSRITHLIRQGVPETHIKKMMWGNVTTDMFQTYAHIVNTDLDDYMADMHGIVRPENSPDEADKINTLEPRQCPECGTVNAPTQNYCGLCGKPLTAEAEESATKAKDELQDLLTDPGILIETLELAKRIKAARGG